MAKVLVIRKTDGTSHQAPLDQKAFLTSINNRLKKEQQFTITEMEEDAAKKVPYFDPKFKGSSLSKIADMSEELKAKEQEIERMKKLLEEKNSSTGAKVKDADLKAKDDEIAQLKAQLAAKSSAATDDNLDDIEQELSANTEDTNVKGTKAISKKNNQGQ